MTTVVVQVGLLVHFFKSNVTPASVVIPFMFTFCSESSSITPKNFVPANDVISFLFTFRRLQLVKLNVRSSSDEIWLSLRSSSLVEAGNWTPVSDAILLFARFSFMLSALNVAPVREVNKLF